MGTLGKSDKMQLTKKEKKTLLEYKSSASYRINELLRNHKDTDELPEQVTFEEWENAGYPIGWKNE